MSSTGSAGASAVKEMLRGGTVVEARAGEVDDGADE